MNIRPINDPDLIKRAFCHPRVLPWASDSITDPDDFAWEPSRWHFALGAFDEDEYLGCFLWEIRNRSTVEGHVCLLPTAWGERATEAGKRVIAWIFANTPFVRINAGVCELNRYGMAYVKRVGMEEWGRAKKGSRGADQVFFGITKEA